MLGLGLGFEFRDSVKFRVRVLRIVFGLGLGLGFRDRFTFSIRFFLVVWVKPGQAGLDGSR